ncbi:hypothetical protein EX30DRAFT_385149 [Ascodesmis nigricans]|uniref:Uncharacterized protein n=1 Tax=Ascodesmis nigricans TaxID=341454 RepID=A0A4S2MMT2_9PEZI|nr:hypothetical protein EX30DRAFT_385149 [Ascodesmis nigricans]
MDCVRDVDEDADKEHVDDKEQGDDDGEVYMWVLLYISRTPVSEPTFTAPEKLFTESPHPPSLPQGVSSSVLCPLSCQRTTRNTILFAIKPDSCCRRFTDSGQASMYFQQIWMGARCLLQVSSHGGLVSVGVESEGAGDADPRTRANIVAELVVVEAGARDLHAGLLGIYVDGRIRTETKNLVDDG